MELPVDICPDWNTGGSTWPSGNSLLCGWLSNGTGCLERLWSLPPWRYSKATWTWSWPCLSQGLDQVMSKGPFQLNHSVVLWVLLEGAVLDIPQHLAFCFSGHLQPFSCFWMPIYSFLKMEIFLVFAWWYANHKAFYDCFLLFTAICMGVSVFSGRKERLSSVKRQSKTSDKTFRLLPPTSFMSHAQILLSD